MYFSKNPYFKWFMVAGGRYYENEKRCNAKFLIETHRYQKILMNVSEKNTRKQQMFVYVIISKIRNNT